MINRIRQIPPLTWDEILFRALWTFVQSSLATITVLPVVTDTAGWELIAQGGLIGGVSGLISLMQRIAARQLSTVEPL